MLMLNIFILTENASNTKGMQSHKILGNKIFIFVFKKEFNYLHLSIYF